MDKIVWLGNSASLPLFNLQTLLSDSGCVLERKTGKERTLAAFYSRCDVTVKSISDWLNLPRVRFC